MDNKTEKSVTDKEVIKKVELEAEDLEVVSLLMDDGTRDKSPKSLSTLGTWKANIKDFFYITDASERTVREDERHKRFYEEPAEGGITIKAPTALSWPVIGSIAVAVFSLLFNVVSTYTRQGSINEDSARRIQENYKHIEELRERMYTKKEIDLQIEAQRAEIRRLDELTRMLKSDIDHLERR